MPAPRDAVFWLDQKDPPRPPLRGTVSADVVVVGGGMMGLMCAQALLARGRQVCLVEASACGEGASGRSSGFITPDSELEFQDLVRQFGPARARQLWAFGWSGVHDIRRTREERAIACDFQPHAALFVGATAGGAKTTQAEHAARTGAGLGGTYFSRERLPEILGSTAYFGGLHFSDTFSVDAYRFCRGLAQSLVASGLRLFEQSPVQEIRADGITTATGTVRAAHVFVCADRFLPSLGLARREVYHAQTFLAVSEPLSPAQVARLFPHQPLMVWDTGLVYKYFRLTADRRLLIGGGTLLSTYARRAQHHPARGARRLTRYLDARFPGLGAQFAAVWPGLIGISKDFAPVVGRHPRFASVRFAGAAAGLPWAAALGRYLAEGVLDGRTELDTLLASERQFPLGRGVQSVIGTPPAFALSHGMLKFRG